MFALRRLWSTPLSTLLLLVALALPASAAGCCSEDLSPATLPHPVLPAGKPDGVLERELRLKNQWGLWLDDVPLPGFTSIPSLDLFDLHVLVRRWKAWANALEAAGRWRYTNHWKAPGDKPRKKE